MKTDIKSLLANVNSMATHLLVSKLKKFSMKDL